MVHSSVTSAVLLALALGMGVWGYKTYDRSREILDFFREPEDLIWARSYLDKKINFCEAPWQQTENRKIGNKEQYSSPTGRFRLKIYTNTEHEEGFDLVDGNDGRLLLSFAFNWDPKGAGLGYDDLKWARNERFLIFRTPITMDSDWTISRIYASDTATGKVIYLGDSEFYECVLKNW